MKEKSNVEQEFTVSKDTAKRIVDETYMISRQKYNRVDEKIFNKETYNPNKIKELEQIINNMLNNEEIFGNGSGDWKEDFVGENGQYTNKCSICKQIFIGNKHRLICKKCATKDITISRKRYEQLLNIEKKYKIINNKYCNKPL